MCDSQQHDAVMASYHRCRSDHDFVDSFYDIFLAKSPDITKLFANTDFRIQKLMLRESLLEMLCFSQGMAGTREVVEDLGQRHLAIGVTKEMYEMWLDALCDAIRRHDPQISIELEQLWRDSMHKGIKLMLAAE